MNTFRFTFPEFPLSPTEKRVTVPLSDETLFISAEGAVTSHGIDFLNFYRENQFDQPRRYLFYFFKQTLLQGLCTSLGGLVGVVGMLALVTGSLTIPIQFAKFAPLMFITCVATLLISNRKGRREMPQLYDRLSKVQQNESI